ncbi:non-specific lipid transfer protein-like 1 [Camellia sinensis]|uniref:non-specific lipid transfer protein-like 1 n=1 Tax=Camellia sinensis TaxID=4442 RepID=UPI0010355864|nr:non-specific lipid transfer protein-like 1 [Camellia sinensis]
MNCHNPIHHFPAIIITPLFASMLALASTSPPPEAARDCSGAVVAFSPCLPFISSPPNNVSSSLSSQCCDIFNSLFDNRGADCLCYFVRQPLILGFPLNSTRLLSLSSRCPLTNSGSNTNGSLESLCSGSSPLPPLQRITGSINSPPPPVDASATQNPSTAIPSSPLESAKYSPAAKQIYCSDWLSLGLVILLVPIFTNLHCHTHH